jgi:hypothetical protein
LHRFFRPGGANSATIAPVVATRAPTPSPVTKRISPKPAVVVVIAVRPMPTENQAYDSSMTVRRPRTSEIVPASNAPTSTPTSA